MTAITTPPGVPEIAQVVEFWSYRTFFDKRPKGCVLIYQKYATFAVDDPFRSLQQELAEVTSPRRPSSHVDNHSGWEVRLKDGKRAFFLFSDLNIYVYQMPEDSPVA